jgi:predicted RecB family nuclease
MDSLKIEEFQMAKRKLIELSKTDYLKYKDCPKLFWFDRQTGPITKSCGESFDELSFEDKRRIRIGKEVGHLARAYFGKYMLVHYNDDFRMECKETDEYIKKKEKIIAEASFFFDGNSCQVDILKYNGNKYDIIEVKSAASVKDEYYDDCAFQYYVVSSTGVPVGNVKLMYLNNQYIRKENLDIKELFVLADLTDAVLEKQNDLKENINKIKKIALSKTEPKLPLERQCIDCKYNKSCGIILPKHNIFTIRGNGMRDDKKWELYKNGIISFSQILKNGYKLNRSQLLQVETEAKKLPSHINKTAIRDFIKTLSYPLYFLDFETYDTVVPEYNDTHPYMKIPFQFSLHILEKKKGELGHREFLADVDKDTRRSLAEKLCEYIPDNVCVLAYHMSFEKGVIRNLAKVFSDLSNHLLKINENLKDLEVPFRSKYYYCRTMDGSYSIKKVLPALLPPNEYPKLDYDILEGVHNGGEAMNLFPELKYLSINEINIYRRQLLEYCCLDTLAMVKILEKLEKDIK